LEELRRLKHSQKVLMGPWNDRFRREEMTVSISGIPSSSLLNYSIQNVQTNMKQIQQEFQQLGQDLQSGNLSAAQSDFATLQQLTPQNNSTLSAQSNSPIAQAFEQLSQDLQSGNLSAAQQDYSTIQQDFQNLGVQMYGRHHHRAGGGGSQTSSQTNPMSQLFEQLGQALQSGNLSTAQQVFSSLQQEFQQLSQSGGMYSGQNSLRSRSTGISVNA
jgi:outer membrane protein assembly factor BamD (BamD/ComL family)